MAYRRRDWLKGVRAISAPAHNFCISANQTTHRPVRKIYGPDDVEAARAWLREVASKHPRKFSETPAYEHSEQVAAEARQLAEGILSPRELYKLEIAALLHDVVEDFGVTLKEVEKRFGAEIAERVKNMTTPNPEELLLLYPDIRKRHLGATPPTRLANPDRGKFCLTFRTLAAQASLSRQLNKLKSTHKDRHFSLKIELKGAYKCGRAENYDLHELIIKAVDSFNTIHTYVWDIASGKIYVIKSHHLTPTPAWNGAPVPMTSATLNKTILHEREEFHQAIQARLKALKHEAQRTGATTLQLNSYDKLSKKLDTCFEEMKSLMERIRDESIAHGGSNVLPFPDLGVAVLPKGNTPYTAVGTSPRPAS